MREEKTRILELRLFGFYFTLLEFDCQVRGKKDGAKVKRGARICPGEDPKLLRIDRRQNHISSAYL